MNTTDDRGLDNQTLSRLMDGEWQDLKAGECLAGVCKSESMKGAWERYHLIRDVMRNEPVAPATTLCDRISAAIADEPTYSNVHSIGASSITPAELSNVESSASVSGADSTLAASTSAVPIRSGGMRTAFKGFALAASVALVTVLGLSVWQGGALPGAGQIASQNLVTKTGVATNSVISDDATEVFFQQLTGSRLPEVDFVSNTASYWVSPETTERSPSENRLNLFLSQHIEQSPTADHQGMFPYSRLVGYEQQVAE